MKRAFVSLCLAGVLAVVGTLAFDAIQGPEQTAVEAKGLKVCKAKTNSGKSKTWRCQNNQACCVNRLMDQYTCGIPGLGCL